MVDLSILNSFKQAQAVKGLLDLRNGAQDLFEVVVNNSSALTDKIESGDVVIPLTSGVSSLPIVDEMTVNTVAPFGIVVYNNKKNTYEAGEVLEIARDGSVVWVEAGEAIARNAAVEFTVLTKRVATVASGKRVGYALDVASAAGDLIRIVVNLEH
jgi:hypothetical protein